MKKRYLIGLMMIITVLTLTIDSLIGCAMVYITLLALGLCIFDRKWFKVNENGRFGGKG